MHNIVLIILTLGLLAGCSSQVKHRRYAPLQSSKNARPQQDLIPVLAALHDQMHTWQGAPYHYGGTTLRGVDCSGFVWRTLKDRFNLPMSRITTRELIHMGQLIEPSRLQPGDLVFFRIHRELHVGFYDTDRHFLHASVHRGVTRSSLDAAYWRNVFLEARRLPNERGASIHLADNN